jgi:lipopolysaccharide/colanic/teichoic acid biosynthesis glycosyltransferase
MPRFVDILIIILILPLLVPVFVMTAILVRLNLGSPIFYRQQRGGYLGKRFDIVKFRSMTDKRGKDGQLLPDADRLTPFGRFLRGSSLDELPCFWNVLKGQMAIVGPRPFIADYLDLYNPEQMTRHNTCPGITGWAQINGRNALSWEEKFELDIWYVQNRSFWLDIRILFLTVKKVLVRHGISADNDDTMPRFTGTRVDRP